jgi:uncharacterized protein YbjT (DUF2867 family)
MRCLVTGATGYIGTRLVPRLQNGGHAVRCLTRSAGKLSEVPWADQVETIEGDLTDPAAVRRAVDSVDVVYYLVHSMGQRAFEDIDRAAATNVARAARQANVRRIIYLGGPEPDADRPASAHLRSRAEVAHILQRSGVPTVVLRAAVIIGSGSASFEMLRHLTERLPAMVTPRWVHNPVQPIAIGDVLYYLAGSATLPPDVHRAFDIGGPEVLSYGDMMRRYAAVAGLRPRTIMPVRPLTPRLSSYWVGLVTPVPAAIARPLIASLTHEAVTHEHDIAAHLPDPPGGLTRVDDAVRAALAGAGEIDDNELPVPEAWSADPARPLPTDPWWSGRSVYTDRRRRPVAAPPPVLWDVIEGIGGEQGWYSFPLAWSVRTWLDERAGGVGRRPGRSHPDHLHSGDQLDFWRVERVVAGRLLRLRAELRLPGRAWLEMRVCADADQRSFYLQRAVFVPRGLAGHLYWAAVWPFHALVFGGMARNIAATAERRARAAGPATDAPWAR